MNIKTADDFFRERPRDDRDFINIQEAMKAYGAYLLDLAADTSTNYVEISTEDREDIVSRILNLKKQIK